VAHPFAASPWPAEDGGPRRLCAPDGSPGLDLQPGERLEATSRDLFAPTMTVLGGPGEVFLLCFTPGVADAVSWVERIDPVTLETVERSPDLPGGPTWPGGLVAHPNGSLHVTFGRWCHRLGEDLSVLASRALPRERPYNSLVVLSDGSLVMKDIGLDGDLPAELVVLDPETLEDRGAPVSISEPSVARLSADGDEVFVVGEEQVHRLSWDGRTLTPTWSSSYAHRKAQGQTFGWDAVVALDALWFLDNGRGTEMFLDGGNLLGKGTSDPAVWLHRQPVPSLHGAHAGSGSWSEQIVIGSEDQPPGIVANPPAMDPERRIVVGFDSANGVLEAFDVPEAGPLVRRWRRQQNHASHMVRWADTGELLTNDWQPDGGEHVVILDVETGEERARVATGSPVQSVIFPSPGWDRDAYHSTFTTLSRIHVT
jgi:hypothetical protein